MKGSIIFLSILFINSSLLWTSSLARRRLEDPKDILGLNSRKRMHSRDVEFTDLGKEYVRGTIWPKPQSEVRSLTTKYHILPQKFQFVISTKSQGKAGNYDVLSSAINRYHELTFPFKNTCQELIEDDEDIKSITQLKIHVKDFMQPLGEGMDESYTLEINAENPVLKSQSVWGALRGLETFSQAVHINGSCYRVARNHIKDKPRFSFRGFLIDTSRHFIPKRIIFAFLDAMSYSKFNVLHWHIVDDPSFPYKSKKFPSLHQNGAFSPKHVYQEKDVQDIIEYAKLRGIRVMPEFDTPGHVHSWGGIKNLLTDCESTSQAEDMFQDLKGPINPTLKSNYEFLKDFFKEVRFSSRAQITDDSLKQVSQVFPDTMVHLGGDEVDFTCWESNQDIKQWLDQKPSRKTIDLHTLYLNKLVQITSKLNKTNVVWQEVFDDKVKIDPKNTIVNVWKQDHGNSWKEEIVNITKKGFRTILSSPWYLNYIAYGLDWPNFYKEDPHASVGDDKALQDLVIGGSACMWGEYVDATNIIQRSFGRSFPVAERLWSDKSVTSVKEALPRIWEHRCRYVARGIPAEPVTRAKYCVQEWGE